MLTLKEQVIDKFLLLYVIETINKHGYGISGKLKLQKIFFLEQLELLNKKIKSMLFKFFRYKNGPFSKVLIEDYDFLSQKRQIFKSTFTLTSDGKELLGAFLKCTQDIPDNRMIYSFINSVLKKYEKYSGQELMYLVYEMEIKPYDMFNKKVSVRDIPINKDIIVPEQYSSFKRKFVLPDEFIEDFVYSLNLDTQDRKSMRESSGVSYEKRFG